MCYPLDGILKLPFSSGIQFDVPNPERIVSIRPDNPAAVEKFVLAVPLIKSLEG